LTRAAGVVPLLALTLLAGCSPRDAHGSPVRLGAIYPVSGPLALGGREEWQGVQLAAEIVNAQGGWRGHRIELVLRDSPSPEAAAAVVQELVDDQRVPVVLGAHSSPVAVEVARSVLRRGAIYWETGAVASDLLDQNHPYFFRTGVDGATLGMGSTRFTADVLAPRLGMQAKQVRVAALYVDDIYGRSVAQGAIAEAGRRGLPVVAELAYDPRAADYDGLVDAIARSSPDVLMVASYLEDGVALRRAALRRHLPIRAMVGTSSAFCLPAFGNILGQDAVGLYASDKPGSQINRAALRPEAARLLERVARDYRRRYGHAPDATALAGFVSGWVLLHDVLPVVDQIDPARIASGARALDLPEGSEITGAGVRFAPAGSPGAGQNLRPASIIWEWQAPRQIVPVFPPAYALKEPIILPIDR